MILTNHEKIILEPEDWSEEEWKIFCKLAHINPKNCESIQIEAGALKAYEKATKNSLLQSPEYSFSFWSVD